MKVKRQDWLKVLFVSIIHIVILAKCHIYFFFVSPPLCRLPVLFPLRSVIQLHHLDVLLKSIMDSWGSPHFSSSFTEYSQCYSNLPTTPSCIGNETPAPTPPHPREIAHLYTQPEDKHSSRAPQKIKKEKILRWDSGENTLCKAETKAAAAHTCATDKINVFIAKSKSSSDAPLKEVASVAPRLGSALCPKRPTVNVNGMDREPNLRSS